MAGHLLVQLMIFFVCFYIGRKCCQETIDDILITLSIFHPQYSFFQRTTYKYSLVSRESKRRTTTNHENDSYFYEDNYGWGKLPAHNKYMASQPITKNKNKKKENKKKKGVQLSLIGDGMEKVYKAPLFWSNMALFIYD